MNVSPEAASPTGSRDPAAPRGSPGFFKWFPWEKLTIWALFLLVVYVLRDFFAVIFLTFIFSYMMTNLVRKTVNVLSLKDRKGEILVHRALTCVYFVIFILALWGVAAFLQKPFETQIRHLITRFQDFRPQTFVEDLLHETVGTWRFNQVYSGEEGEEKRLADLEKFDKERFGETAYHRFEGFREHVTKEFLDAFKTDEGKAELDKLRQEEGLYFTALREWIRNSLVPELYSSNAALWQEQFKESYVELFDQDNYAALATDPEKLETHVLDYIALKEFKRLKEFSDPPAEFVDELGKKALSSLEQSEYNERFQQFYEKERRPLASDPKYSWDQFKGLADAFLKSHLEFDDAVREVFGMNSKEEEKAAVEDHFEGMRKAELAAEVLEGWNIDLVAINKYITSAVPQVGFKLGSAGIYLFNFVVQFALSLMLSFFITFDLPRMKKGIVALERSRAQNFYHEIAPGLAAFGMLIGRAFQAQGIIAICNTLLTFALIKALDIQFEAFLCTIVFICSFIPVLGVILSSVPIAIIAFQYKGLEVALYSIGGVLLIHFFETSVLNPKILGEMLHLHPVLVLGILVVGEHFFKVWGLLLGVPVMVYIIHYVILGHDITHVLRGGTGGVTPPATGPPVASEEASDVENSFPRPEPVTIASRENADDSSN
jgi:predicted PurR-regulated permease PerM